MTGLPRSPVGPSENAAFAPLTFTGEAFLPPWLWISPTILPNALRMLSAFVALITSPPSSDALSLPRTNSPMSPIHPNTSRSRSIPYCCWSCCVAAAPPKAPATRVNRLLSPGPTFGAP